MHPGRYLHKPWIPAPPTSYPLLSATLIHLFIFSYYLIITALDLLGEARDEGDLTLLTILLFLHQLLSSNPVKGHLLRVGTILSASASIVGSRTKRISTTLRPENLKAARGDLANVAKEAKRHFVGEVVVGGTSLTAILQYL